MPVKHRPTKLQGIGRAAHNSGSLCDANILPKRSCHLEGRSSECQWVHDQRERTPEESCLQGGQAKENVGRKQSLRVAGYRTRRMFFDGVSRGTRACRVQRLRYRHYRHCHSGTTGNRMDHDANAIGRHRTRPASCAMPVYRRCDACKNQLPNFPSDQRKYLYDSQIAGRTEHPQITVGSAPVMSGDIVCRGQGHLQVAYSGNRLTWTICRAAILESVVFL